MKEIITRNDLLRYLYHECSENESVQIEQIIETNSELKDALQLLKETKSFLGRPKYQPSRTCINSIMDYSRSSHAMEV